MGGHLGSRRYAGGLRRREGLYRRARGEVHEVDRPLLGAREREVSLDHHALRESRIGPDAELGGHGTLVCMSVAGQRGILAMKRERAARHGAVLECAAHEPRRDDGPTVIRERRRTRGGERRHLGQLSPLLALADRGHEPRRHDRLAARTLKETGQHRSRVDDGIGVRHREDRAVPSSRSRLAAGRDRLFVLPAGAAQVHVGIDERGGDHVAVRARRLERRDDAVSNRDAQALVDALRRSNDSALERYRVRPPVPADERHATRTAASTGAGTGAVSRS
jgi:hypothetical protein